MDLPAVFQYLRPNAEWSLNGDTYIGLVWIGPGDAPTESECVEAWPLVQTALNNSIARNNRHRAFVAEADPLFFAWQRGENTEQDWLTKCAEIRARYPYV
jgi:hypothetical protein